MNATSREPILIGSSILAGLQVIVAGAALADVIGPKWAGFLALVVAALTMGWGTYARGLVTPEKDVAAKEAPTGDLVAGPAAEAHADVTEGEPVEVVPDPATPAGERRAPTRDARGRFTHEPTTEVLYRGGDVDDRAGGHA